MKDTDAGLNSEGETYAPQSRREFMKTSGALAAAGVAGLAVLGGGMAAAPATAAAKKKTATTVDLDWKEVYYTNCPLVSASNVDQELGWTKEEYGRLGVDFAYFRSRRETNWYPHYIHNQENLIRFGGLFPPIHVQADIRRTRLLGATHVPNEGGCMLVRARDDIYRMSDLKGKEIGITKSLNTIKNDFDVRRVYFSDNLKSFIATSQIIARVVELLIQWLDNERHIGTL